MAINISDYVTKKYLEQLFGGKDAAQKSREKITLESLEKSNQLSDVSMLNSLVSTASSSEEFANLNKMIGIINKKKSGYDPVIQGKIEGDILQAKEKTALYSNYKGAMEDWVTDYASKYKDLTEDDISKWDWEDISDDVREISRLKNIIDLGAERGYTYKSGNATYDSKIVKNKIKNMSDTFDAAVYYLADLPPDKFERNLQQGQSVASGGRARMNVPGIGVIGTKENTIPYEAARFILTGNTPELKAWKTREVNKSKQYFDRHSSNYTILTGRLNEALSKKTVGDTINISPDTMLKRIKEEGGDEAVQTYLKAIGNDAQLKNDFMTGLQNKTSVVMDYNKYSKLLQMQRDFEEQRTKESSEMYKKLTGEIPEKFETFDIKAASKLLGTLQEPSDLPWRKLGLSIEDYNKYEKLSKERDMSIPEYIKAEKDLEVPKKKTGIKTTELLSPEEERFKISAEKFDLVKSVYNEVSDSIFDIEKQLRKFNTAIKRGYDYDKSDYENKKYEVASLREEKENLFKELETRLETKQSARRGISAKSADVFYRKHANLYLEKMGLPKTGKNWEKAMNHVIKQYSPKWWVSWLAEPVVEGKEKIAQYLRKILK